MKILLLGLSLLFSTALFSKECDTQKLLEISNKMNSLLTSHQIRTAPIKPQYRYRIGTEGDKRVEYIFAQAFEYLQPLLNYRGDTMLSFSEIKNDIIECGFDEFRASYNTILNDYSRTILRQNKGRNTYHLVISPQEFNRLILE